MSLTDTLFEPRALWDVRQLQPAGTSGNQPDPGFVFPKDSFRNTSRYPMTLTKLLISPIGYLLAQNKPTGTPVPAAYDNCMAALSKARIGISAPGRYYFTYSNLNSSFLKCDRVAGTTMKYSATPYASSLMGLSRWFFEKPYSLIRNGIVHFEASGLVYAAAEVPANLFTPNAQYDFAFWEKDLSSAPRFGGDVRHRGLRPVGAIEIANPSTISNKTAWPHGPSPLVTDNAGYNVLPLNPSDTWNKDGDFLPHIWRLNEMARGKENNWLTGFSVMIDQITSDDQVQNSGNPDLVGLPLAPMSQRIITRCRTVAGPTGEWWWRPGAPLSLVSPHGGPSIVYTLDTPITLGPGEELQVEVETPATVFPTQPVPSVQRYNIGVSFTGYASVKG